MLGKTANIFLRITTGWTLSRLLYVLIGVILITQTTIDKEWFGTLIGAYFTSMGLFNYGCASPNGCTTSNCKTPNSKEINAPNTGQL